MPATTARALLRAALTAALFLAPAPALARQAAGQAMQAVQPGGEQDVSDPTFLEQWASTFRFRLGNPTSIKVTPDGQAVLFLRSGPRSFVNDLYEFDVRTGQERVLLTADQILKGAEENLTAEELARRERMRSAARGIASFALSEDGEKVLVPLSGRLFVVRRATGAVVELPSEGGFPIDPRFSPDATRVATVRDGDLYTIEINTGRQFRLTDDPSPTVTFGLAEFVAQEEMSRFEGFWWSPDATAIAFTRVDTAGMEVFTIMDPTDPSKTPQSWPYPRPGKRNAEVRLFVQPLNPNGSAAGTPVEARWDREAFPYIATVRWNERGPLVMLVQDRLQEHQVLLRVDPATGETTRLLEERDPTWINLDQAFPRWLTNGRQFLWSSERQGAWRMEVRRGDGEPMLTIAGPSIGYRDGLLGLDESNGFAYVLGGEDPREQHVYRVALNPELSSHPEPKRLTEGRGIHTGFFAKNGSTWVHQFEPIEGGTTWTVRSTGPDGVTYGSLRSVREEPPFQPQIELVTVRGPASGEEFHAAIVRPRNFRPGLKYPVLVSVYGGPGVQVATASASRQLLNQWYADHGMIVVSIDGRGTPGRGRAWERAIDNCLITIPLADQIDALRGLAAARPELDMSRVGIYGWSFGGYFSAMAAMRHPEVFRVGVAGAPVADWRDYDTHYTERFLGLPERNPSGYDGGSVLTYAPSLERPLLIVHGTADDNVYFMHALKMSDALFRAGKQHDFLALAGFTHMVPDPVVTKRLYGGIADYLVRHLRN